MTRSSIQTSKITIENLVEGSPNHNEPQEPQSPNRTATLPTVEDNPERPRTAAETGVVAAVELPGEGFDDNEGQDSSRTKDEIKPEAKLQNVPPAPSTSAPVVLIVEDTTELAEVIQATLERMNLVTVHETHGGRAISSLDTTKPDVVLLDISLPDMTGWKILDAIKEKYDVEKDPKATMPIIIIISAYGDPANRLVGKLQGVYSYLIKPFTADEVERVVMGALGSATG